MLTLARTGACLQERQRSDSALVWIDMPLCRVKGAPVPASSIADEKLMNVSIAKAVSSRGRRLRPRQVVCPSSLSLHLPSAGTITDSKPRTATRRSNSKIPAHSLHYPTNPTGTFSTQIKGPLVAPMGPYGILYPLP